ncbi:hypothetical protein JZ751_015285 [Albula glossodonta]|uniref:Uncharacterized protein n=1 Tax=Albula glossodonta TaxID=121402 RepID=A0A8T2P337_9TELE|nr:hypothetical protein JZ751_015285 [Albula glossodonta]
MKRRKERRRGPAGARVPAAMHRTAEREKEKEGERADREEREKFLQGEPEGKHDHTERGSGRNVFTQAHGTADDSLEGAAQTGLELWAGPHPFTFLHTNTQVSQHGFSRLSGPWASPQPTPLLYL